MQVKFAIMSFLAVLITIIAFPAHLPAMENKVTSTLEKIKSRGYMIVGVLEDAAPFGFLDEQPKDLKGFDVDLCRHIVNKLGVNVRFRAVSYSNRTAMLAQGSVDLIAAAMTHTFSREKEIDFSITYFMSVQKLLVKKGSAINNISGLAGKKVGIVKGSTSGENIKKIQPESEIRSFEHYSQAFRALQQNKIMAFCGSVPMLLGLKHGTPDPEEWIIVENPISKLPYGLGLQENDSDFRDFINKTLVDMWNSSEYRKLYDKWFGPGTNYQQELNWEMETWPY